MNLTYLSECGLSFMQFFYKQTRYCQGMSESFKGSPNYYSLLLCYNHGLKFFEYNGFVPEHQCVGQ
jgi:hypothetical protein